MNYDKLTTTMYIMYATVFTLDTIAVTMVFQDVRFLETIDNNR